MDEVIKRMWATTFGRILTAVITAMVILILTGCYTTARNLQTKQEVDDAIKVEIDKKEAEIIVLENRVQKLEEFRDKTIIEIQEDLTELKVNVALLVGRQQERDKKVR